MKHCLVIDDSRTVRKIARRILEEMQFSVSEAEDGVAGLGVCRTHMPDAILLDWHMPNMNGIEFLHALRCADGGGRPIVLLCTAENEMAFVEAAMKAGADEYIMKPFDREILELKFLQVGLTEGGLPS